jgi:hypothetical protein
MENIEVNSGGEGQRVPREKRRWECRRKKFPFVSDHRLAYLSSKNNGFSLRLSNQADFHRLDTGCDQQRLLDVAKGRV